MQKSKLLLRIVIPSLMLLQLACSSQKFNLPSQSVSYQQVPTMNNKVDVLFVLDDSSAMFTYRQQMATQAQNMITQLNAMGMDYHLAVTSTSVGAGYAGGTFINNTYLTNSTSSVASALATLLTFNSVAGSELEQGLLSMQQALSAPNITNAGKGFLRSEAMLAVVFISSDDDYSSGTVASYQSFLNALKPPFANGAQSWVVNYVGSTSLTSLCQNFVNVGQRYITLANASSGISQSIACNNSNWALLMTDIQVIISTLMTDYYFSVAPNPSTIVVKVNGVVVPQSATNGWTYKTGTNSSGATTWYIQFNGSAVPNVYQSIAVTFTPASAS